MKAVLNVPTGRPDLIATIFHEFRNAGWKLRLRKILKEGIV
jgi:hypothetical protein